MNWRSELLKVTAMSSSRRGSVLLPEQVLQADAWTLLILRRREGFDYGRGTWNMVGARNFRRDDGLGAWSPPDQTFGVPSLIYLRLREAVRLSAMILALSSQWVIGRGARALQRWGELRVPHRLAVGACLLVLAGMTYVGFYVTEHIREHAIQRAAGGVALYMDSVVERHVQELAT